MFLKTKHLIVKRNILCLVLLKRAKILDFPHFYDMRVRYNRIRIVLAEKEKTNQWLAEQVGRSKGTVSKWCSNQMQPPLDILFQIADVLEVDVCELLTKNEKSPKKG
jgi:DNA-binding XRE family transcriptional regulator